MVGRRQWDKPPSFGIEQTKKFDTSYEIVIVHVAFLVVSKVLATVMVALPDAVSDTVTSPPADTVTPVLLLVYDTVLGAKPVVVTLADMLADCPFAIVMVAGDTVTAVTVGAVGTKTVLFAYGLTENVFHVWYQ